MKTISQPNVALSLKAISPTPKHCSHAATQFFCVGTGVFSGAQSPGSQG